MPTSTNSASIHCFDLTAVIASGQTTSQAIDVSGTTLCGLFIPASLTGTAVSLQASNAIGGTYVTVQDGAGNDLSLTVTLSRYIPINNLAITAGLRFIQVVSNASEAATRAITLATRPV